MFATTDRRLVATGESSLTLTQDVIYLVNQPVGGMGDADTVCVCEA